MSIQPNNKPKVQSEVVAKMSAGADNVYLQAGEQFTNTSYTQSLIERALAYLQVGYAVHFTGPAGIGKTTMALHVAAQLGNPVILVHGNDEVTSSNLIGKEVGYHRSKVVDNFVHSVIKTEEELTTLWVDNRLTTACEHGYTLVYDEFNRSRAETNNILLSILSEKILSIPGRNPKERADYLKVHPNFRAIFISNSEESVGVYKPQNALMDRLITITVDYPNKESEIQIVLSWSEIAYNDAALIVDLARAIRQIKNNSPSIRGCIAIARVLANSKRPAIVEDSFFQAICCDIFAVDLPALTQALVSLKRIEDHLEPVVSL